MKRFAQQFRHVAVQLPEVPHPAYIARGEAGHIRVLFFQELRSNYRRPLLRAGADDLIDLAVQLHLRQIRFHDRFQFGKHCAVIHSFSDIHKAQFRREHESTLILYEAAAKALKEQGVKKLPDLYALKAEYKRLAEEKERLYEQYGEAKKRMQEYGIIKQNVDGILRVKPGKEWTQEL